MSLSSMLMGSDSDSLPHNLEAVKDLLLTSRYQIPQYTFLWSPYRDRLYEEDLQ